MAESKHTIREWLKQGKEVSTMIMFDDKPHMIGGCNMEDGVTNPQKRPPTEQFIKEDGSSVPTIKFGTVPWYPQIGDLTIRRGKVVNAARHPKYPGIQGELGQILQLRQLMRLRGCQKDLQMEVHDRHQRADSALRECMKCAPANTRRLLTKSRHQRTVRRIVAAEGQRCT